jgi:hypothetical protein
MKQPLKSHIEQLLDAEIARASRQRKLDTEPSADVPHIPKRDLAQLRENFDRILTGEVVIE